jgi:uncharacterized protein (DUF58 family)
MPLRLRFVPLAAFLALAAILGSIRDLAGPLSRMLSVVPLFLAAASLLHLVLTWTFFSFHQTFSTDHPSKGEIVRYRLRVTNGMPVPAAVGVCRFAAAGPAIAAFRPMPLALSALGLEDRSAEIVCAYRGIYVIGAESFSFRGALGILEIVYRTEPRVFYVYPELVPLGSGVERLAMGGGEGKSAAGAGERDPTVFETLRPLVDGAPARRVAWKRWAASGVPCAAEEGRSAAFGLRVMLDLRPSGAVGDDKLAAEDLAVTAAYSALSRLAEGGIPAEFWAGGEAGRSIDDRADFDAAYAQSTSVIFSESAFPEAAFSGGRATLLITTRSIAADDPDSDLFSALERAALRGYPVRLAVVPPPSRADAEAVRVRAAADRLSLDPRWPAAVLLDPRKGTEDLTRVFAG